MFMGHCVVRGEMWFVCLFVCFGFILVIFAIIAFFFWEPRVFYEGTYLNMSYVNCCICVQYFIPMPESFDLWKACWNDMYRETCTGT